jgi:hypothetical protein
MENYTPINHADIFESLETFGKILGPIIRDDGFLEISKVALPNWHLFSDRGIFTICKTQEGENPKLELVCSINPKISIEEATDKKWVYRTLISEDFEVIKGFFVNNTLFSNRGGQFRIVNGPKEFTWTFREPEICPSCQEKENAENAND